MSVDYLYNVVIYLIELSMMTVETASMCGGDQLKDSVGWQTVRIDLVLFFFFSSRRRHTRLQGDWSSDVCSSDLARGGHVGDAVTIGRPRPHEVARLSVGEQRRVARFHFVAVELIPFAAGNIFQDRKSVV